MRHGSNLDPPNRFDRVRIEDDFEHLGNDDEVLRGRQHREIQYFEDDAKSIVSENDSPDIPFRYSVNPYRGCVHACPYCYARNSHEYLGLNAGLDFETKIYVKRAAPSLFADFLRRDSWHPEPIVFSSVTDCYQPAEREFRLTRGCLEVANSCGQPISIITKNGLVVRDIELLREMGARRLVQVNISITTLDGELAMALEPRTSTPSARLRTIGLLVEADIPVRVMVAPVIPGLNDHEIPAILNGAKAAGASDAGYGLLRLPLTVEPVFREWLARTRSTQVPKVENLLRETRQGRLNDTTWGQRMIGTGVIAEQIRSMFHIFRQKLAFPGLPKLDVTQFKPPVSPNGERRLF